ncbi:hypothetical protein C3432_09975 [Citrobacter amalonaticus]|nr:hypothetical protein C3432_09975 [Citrobacter amalonaticus]POT76251.1 hypothetical protein C3436_01845 [Citrobacter amalonaticus]POV05486.1 hypothetical protein C3424_09150 [Citrobacter amalonaticus]
MASIFILVILQVAGALALLLGPSQGLALSGQLQAAFKSVPDRFVVHPSHVLVYAPGDSPLRGQRKRCSKRLRVLSRNSNYLEY